MIRIEHDDDVAVYILPDIPGKAIKIKACRMLVYALMSRQTQYIWKKHILFGE